MYYFIADRQMDVPKNQWPGMLLYLLHSHLGYDLKKYHYTVLFTPSAVLPTEALTCSFL